MPYYIRWLDQTFHSRKQTEELLTPEVQDGTITQQDYELAVRFLPGNHRYYGVRTTVFDLFNCLVPGSCQPHRKWVVLV